MDKDAKGKGKGKTHTLRVKGGKYSAEEQDVKESMDQPRAFVAFGKVIFSLLDKMELFLSSFDLFRFLKPKVFSAFDFSIGVIVKSFLVGIFVRDDMKCEQ